MSDRPTPKIPTSNPSPASPKEVSAASFAGIGLQFALGIVIFLFLGKWIDSRFGTGPTGVIAGVFIGAIAGFYLLYRKLSAAQKEDDRIHGRHTL